MEEATQRTDFFFRLWSPTAKTKEEGVTPEDFNAKEVGELLIHLEAVFKSFYSSDREKKAHEPFLSLVEVRNQSLGLHFKPSNKKFFEISFLAITTALSSGNFENIPIKSIEHLQAIQKLVKSKDIEGQFILGDKEYAQLKPETYIAAPEQEVLAPIRGETVLYGQITKTGGVNPIVQVAFDSGENLTCTVSRKLAKELAKNLYSKVSLKGTAAWSAIDYELVEFRIDSFAVFNPSKPTQAFAKLGNVLGKYWDDISDVEGFINNKQI